MLPLSFFNQPVVDLAPALLGCELVHESSDGITAGTIVEVEAYRQDDPASHSFGGKTKRNEVMFGPGGHAYIYFTYGMHYCFNVVAGEEGFAEGVLIRALEPTQGIELMQKRRRTALLTNLCSGPAKLVQAMGLQPAQNGVSVISPTLHLVPRREAPAILASPRIGITKATDTPWRFFIAGNRFVSSSKVNTLAVPWEGGQTT